MVPGLRSLVPRWAEVAAMLRLAAPVVVVQVGMMTMGVVDTMVVGRVSAAGLAAVALGNLTVMAVCAFGRGPVGLWWGLVLGLAVVATLLLGRVGAKLAHPVARVDVGV
jgi:Na+-driven multidrug efflux pump